MELFLERCGVPQLLPAFQEENINSPEELRDLQPEDINVFLRATEGERGIRLKLGDKSRLRKAIRELKEAYAAAAAAAQGSIPPPALGAPPLIPNGTASHSIVQRAPSQTAQVLAMTPTRPGQKRGREVLDAEGVGANGVGSGAGRDQKQKLQHLAASPPPSMAVLNQGVVPRNPSLPGMPSPTTHSSMLMRLPPSMAAGWPLPPGAGGGVPAPGKGVFDPAMMGTGATVTTVKSSVKRSRSRKICKRCNHLLYRGAYVHPNRGKDCHTHSKICSKGGELIPKYSPGCICLRKRPVGDQFCCQLCDTAFHQLGDVRKRERGHVVQMTSRMNLPVAVASGVPDVDSRRICLLVPPEKKETTRENTQAESLQQVMVSPGGAATAGDAADNHGLD
uniref:SAM domain-containing protein n=1 Tax=Lotharella oceanica TaxID=641309 RepID=A0A7S2XI97_9EUKA|mmetsp:Transcript_3746/g.7219  ORF Transcript_3746/g.7219 Transcript_3746/m.7219 type:complete len:392 (+) Transcript_3746:49-1224(+)